MGDEPEHETDDREAKDQTGKHGENLDSIASPARESVTGHAAENNSRNLQNAWQTEGAGSDGTEEGVVAFEIVAFCDEA